MKKLIVQAMTKYIAGIILVELMIFLPAVTFSYPGGWLFMGLLFVPMLILGIVLLIKAPDLLAKRLKNKEEQVLEAGLAGYREYKEKVRYRLIPFIL